MWLCKRCKTKNNNNSLKCHGKGCKADKEHEAIIPKEVQKREELKFERRVLDFCPKCKKETIFEFLRLKDKRKTFKCTECNAVCYQKGKSKQVPEVLMQ